jgi:two-component system response regulator FixJ
MLGSKVYVIDDDAAVRKALNRLLNSAGFSVETFASAEDFLSHKNHNPGACLILDLHLPGKNGLDLLQHLAEVGQNIPTVIISAHDDESIQNRTEKLGAVFLRKPFTADELVCAMKTVEQLQSQNLSMKIN